MRVVSLACLLAGVVAVTSADAVTVLPATFEELVRESVSVVHGRVLDVEGRWTPDRRTIESTVTLDVVETLKGTATDTASFVVPGGRAGDRILVMPGAPTFRAGDEVIVFLRGRAPALPQPVGLSLGVYRVSADRRGGVPLVVPTPIASASAAGVVRRGASNRPVRTLPAFAADVRAVEPGR